MPANGEIHLDEPISEDNPLFALINGCDRFKNMSIESVNCCCDASYQEFKVTENNAEEPVGGSPRYASRPDRESHERLIRDCVEDIINLAVFDATDRKHKVLEWRSPDDLRKLLDFTVQKTGSSDSELKQLVRNVIKYSVKTGHPYFVNQLFSSVDPYALIGQWLTDALNPSVYTYEVAPVFTLMEESVLQEMRQIVGFPNGDGDGIFCPGGSIANGYAIGCARYKFMPSIKNTGLAAGARLVIFTSEDAHYSIKKLASFMGIGCDNVYAIQTDKRGKLRVEHLESEILRAKSEGALPFMVSATAGTTVLGAFDPLEEIREICTKYNLWMHVDAAWGGGALLSKRYRDLLKGVEKADSITWNPHKLLAAPQQCSTFLTQHKDVLAESNSTNATYLFQKDKFYDTKYDTGDKHIQCGRRADVLKFWFMWKAKGTEGLEKHINQVFESAEFFTQKIKQNPAFELVLENPECTNICFWYLPPALRDTPRGKEFEEALHTVAPKIKEKMMKEGTMMMTYQPLGELPNFFRLVIQNSSLNKQDMLYIIDEIERLGSNL